MTQQATIKPAAALIIRRVFESGGVSITAERALARITVEAFGDDLTAGYTAIDELTRRGYLEEKGAKIYGTAKAAVALRDFDAEESQRLIESTLAMCDRIDATK